MQPSKSNTKLPPSFIHCTVLGALLLFVHMSFAKPRPPCPPMPGMGILHDETFDGPFYSATNQVIDPTVYAESWSGYSLRRVGAYVNPYTLPLLAPDASLNFDSKCGAIRAWFKPEWSSASTGAGNGPGALARVFSLVITNASSHESVWSVVISPNGNTVQLLCPTEVDPSVCLSAEVSLRAGNWYLFTFGYSETNCNLFINDQKIAAGGGLLVLPAEVEPYTRLVFGSSLKGTDTANGELEEITTFSAKKPFFALPGHPFGLSEQDDIVGYYSALSKIVALGPISDSELALQQQASLARAATQQTAVTSSTMTALQSPEGTAFGSLDALPCVTGGPVYITNSTVTFNSDSGWGTSFEVAGGNSGLLYDVFAAPALGSSSVDTPWIWLGRTPTCSAYTLTGQSSNFTFYVLGTPQDSDGDGISDAYCNLILKASPPLGYTPSSDGFGTPDAWYLAHGLNPLTAATQDANQNGILNWQEYKRGADPLEMTSASIWLAMPNGLSSLP